MYVVKAIPYFIRCCITPCNNVTASIHKWCEHLILVYQFPSNGIEQRTPRMELILFQLQVALVYSIKLYQLSLTERHTWYICLRLAYIYFFSINSCLKNRFACRVNMCSDRWPLCAVWFTMMSKQLNCWEPMDVSTVRVNIMTACVCDPESGSFSLCQVLLTEILAKLPCR